MSKSTPSLLALLGLVAVAGYQNRGKISEMLADARRDARDRPQENAQNWPTGQRPTEPDKGFLSELGKSFGAGTSGGTIANGLNDLLGRFKDAGRSVPADSWVSSTQDNLPIDNRELEEAIGDETLEEIGQKMGLPRNELLRRLNTGLPQVVDVFTPNGRLPTEAEARDFN